ncbi:Nif3-like dinuclear metal center hexameric protein [Intestinibacter bartlettii]|uniref:GTP cyclohydrolase 1 type 2 homolog n=1 Tax=Intestinibacter bartlettii TaxID=261299 RepID=A0ABS6DU41_9FIRM|nr:Nif3-like dinuclear metal center hexameric protein [Intestinibacter bartlettii]MBU5334831.1 Nif3-like dinuclear metal center hexameric protein [Intestinibacter bartlettii]MDO5011264.1 Nif3-like dinuclear metal center hexameric protein [Intestinibacter bartlettii]
MKLRNLIDKIESKYPTNLAYSWDNVGLLVGEYEKEVKKILVTLEANEKVVDEAIQMGIDLIITHHPFIFSKINRVNSGDLKGRLILKLIKNDISLYSMHTNFDIAKDGLNDYFMEIMGFENCEILEETHSEKLYKLAVYVPETHAEAIRGVLGENNAGYIGNYSHCTFNISGTGTFKPEEGTNPFLGTIGNIEEAKEIKIETVVPKSILNKVIKEMIKAHPYEEVAYDVYELQNEGQKQGLGRIATLNEEITLEELANKIKTTLNMDKIRLVGDLNSKIKRVALCTGAGSDLVKLSKIKGAQVLITGDMKYHEAQDALDMNMNVIDCGHFDTEDIFKDVMKRFIDTLDEFETIKSEVYLNPFKII